MKQVIKTYIKVFPIFLLLIFFVTYGLLRAYFEQDEWAGFSLVINLLLRPWWHIFIPFEMHFSPIPTLIWSSMYQLFHLNAQYYYLVEFIIHASVSALIYILSERLTSNKYISILTAIFFLLNSRAHQVFTHLAIFNSTDTCMFFIASFFVYLTTIKGKILSLKQAFILFILFLLAVFTREEGYILIPTFIAYIVCFDKEKININNLKAYGLMFFCLLLFLFGRYYAQTLRTESIPVKYQISASRAAYNFATIPIKLVVQNLVYSERLAVFFQKYHEKFYPGVIKNIYMDSAPLLDLGFTYLFTIFVSFIVLWLLLIKPKRIKPILAFMSVWVFSHAFMLSFLGYPIFVLEPRYLYFSAFPVFCFMSIMLYTIFTSYSRYSTIRFFAKSVVIVVISILFVTSFLEIRNVVRDEIKRGEIKKTLLHSLHHVHPTLGTNTIFFVQCKTKCYRNSDLGIPNENTLPFSSGPGMILLISYTVGHEKEWGQFFTNSFLFDIYAEDYKKIGERSFGYFVTKSKLEDTLKKNNVSKDIVVALEYNEENYTFTDISEEFKKTIDGI